MTTLGGDKGSGDDVFLWAKEPQNPQNHVVDETWLFDFDWDMLQGGPPKPVISRVKQLITPLAGRIFTQKSPYTRPLLGAAIPFVIDGGPPCRLWVKRWFNDSTSKRFSEVEWNEQSGQSSACHFRDGFASFFFFGWIDSSRCPK